MRASPARPVAPPVDRLPPFDDEGRLCAVIEAGRGTRGKYKFSPALGAFELHHLLLPGFSHPFDFGFVPSTRAGDGDPLDVLVLGDEPVPPGMLVPCRALGVPEAEQRKPEADGAESNDRLRAVAAASHDFAGCRRLADLPPGLLDRIEGWFTESARVRGIDFRILGRGGPRRALRLVPAARRAAR